jgi:hypothetical protein
MRKPGMARRSLVLLLMCVVFCAQAVSLAWDHSHPDSQHCCGLCHAGPLPFLQPPISGLLAPAVAVAWLASPSDINTAHETLLSSGSSRAPPAC